MAERKGSKRTQKGLGLQRTHQSNYEKWWLGKNIETTYFQNLEESEDKITGEAVKVEYIGNSMVGVVEITLDNGCVYTVGGGGKAFSPRKKDVKVIQ